MEGVYGTAAPDWSSFRCQEHLLITVTTKEGVRGSGFAAGFPFGAITRNPAVISLESLPSTPSLGALIMYCWLHTHSLSITHTNHTFTLTHLLSCNHTYTLSPSHTHNSHIPLYTHSHAWSHLRTNTLSRTHLHPHTHSHTRFRLATALNEQLRSTFTTTDEQQATGPVSSFTRSPDTTCNYLWPCHGISEWLKILIANNWAYHSPSDLPPPIAPDLPPTTLTHPLHAVSALMNTPMLSTVICTTSWVLLLLWHIFFYIQYNKVYFL